DDAEMEPRVGSVAVFGFGNRATVFRMRIDDLVPGRRVVWSCEGEPGEWQDTQLTFELTPTPNGGTRLRFSHTGWRSPDGCFATCNSRWGVLMHRLKAFVEGEEVGAQFAAQRPSAHLGEGERADAVCRERVHEVVEDVECDGRPRGRAEPSRWPGRCG